MMPTPSRITGALAFALALSLVAPTRAPAQSGGISATEYGARRDALAASIDSGAVIVFGAREPAHHYPRFAQLPSFNYLTGYDEPDAALLIVKRSGSVTSTLFVTPVDAIGEIFNGRRATDEEIRGKTGLASRSFAELKPMLDALADRLPLYAVNDVYSADFASFDTLTYGKSFVKAMRAEHPSLRLASADAALRALRAKKSAAELLLVRKAVDISVAGHKAGLCAIKPSAGENNVQAMMEYVFRNQGADGPGYASIVGSGPNGTTLHYDRDERTMNAGEMVVMDVAAQYHGYSADVTRTAPVSGTFTPEQRAIYQVVRDAQAAAERQAKIGAPGHLMADSANASMAAGLAKLGLIESADATFDPPWKDRCARIAATCTQRYLFMPHGLGHGIGLDVHDPAQYSSGADATMQPGDAFTIEPGVYVRPNILDNLPDTPKNRAMISRLRSTIQRYTNIGIRIEDDYVVTESGVEWVSRAPREASEIEASMKNCPARVIP